MDTSEAPENTEDQVKEDIEVLSSVKHPITTNEEAAPTDSTNQKNEENDVLTTTNEEAANIDSTNQMRDDCLQNTDSTNQKTEVNDAVTTTSEKAASTDSTNQLKETNDSANHITDEYHYTKSGEYTSEMFKVVVQNIPKRVTYGVRKYDSRLGKCKS